MYSKKRIDTIRKMECKMFADIVDINWKRDHKLGGDTK